MLTAKQRDLLNFLREYQQEHDHAPSFDEMKDAVGLKSKSGIHRLVSALEERGHIRRLANRARAIEIIDETPVAQTNPTPSADSNVVHAHFGQASSLSLPLLGQIAAGTPIEALSDHSRFFGCASLYDWQR